MKKVLIAGIKGYQKGISPLFQPSCRYIQPARIMPLKPLKNMVL